MKRVLLICFYFPPMQGSTGSLRAASFARYLPEFGWRVTVLTAREGSYRSSNPANQALVPAGTDVIRTRAWDLSRLLSVRGRYPRVLALPDRWLTWFVTAVWAGLRICRSEAPPSIIISTYPTPTTHLVAYALHRLTRIPWVAEFRDPMVEENYPSGRLERRIRQWIEARVAKYAAQIVTVTDGAAEMYRTRFPQAASRIVVVENGYEDYLDGEAAPGRQLVRGAQPTVFLHSGVLYPAERDPTSFLEALARLKSLGKLHSDRVQFVFRGAGNEKHYMALVESLGIADLVEFRPTVSYQQASAEMAAADVLMVLQGRACNRQIPAKAYEYLYRAKPILALADPVGDTARLLARHGVEHIAALEDAPAIEGMLLSLLKQLDTGRKFFAPEPGVVAGLSRRARCRDLARLLEEALDGDPSDAQGAAVGTNLNR